jgi:hypothetical protein
VIVREVRAGENVAIGCLKIRDKRIVLVLGHARIFEDEDEEDVKTPFSNCRLFSPA